MANGLFNNYTITPRNLTQYTAYRGVTDFSQVGQFQQFETGYSFLSVISIPKFLELDATMTDMNKNFKHMLEYEFRGLDGLPDITTDNITITDGINDLNMIGKVTMDTSATISMNYFEKQGSLIERYSEYYLTGIKDPKSQAKTYHGLIANGTLAPGYENEVFTLLYYVTDNTMLRLERAVLLANCQLTKAELSQLNSTRGDINNKEYTLEFNCFPIVGSQVDKAANALLHQITGVNVNVTNGNVIYGGYDQAVTKRAALDSTDYKYAIMDEASPAKLDTLVDALNA